MPKLSLPYTYDIMNYLTLISCISAFASLMTKASLDLKTQQLFWSHPCPDLHSVLNSLKYLVPFTSKRRSGPVTAVSQ